jgi:hypothetical protein
MVVVGCRERGGAARGGGGGLGVSSRLYFGGQEMDDRWMGIGGCGHCWFDI